ncbi:Rieske (2Fe-2S) protein [Acetobacter sp. DsW_063]|uniref:QcrA and Rieske domain-containing protein n=1 Tax=Acetobacter sp. DsW_063 TaxID=1514894 RepID=UPI000A3D5E6A
MTYDIFMMISRRPISSLFSPYKRPYRITYRRRGAVDVNDSNLLSRRHAAGLLGGALCCSAHIRAQTFGVSASTTFATKDFLCKVSDNAEKRLTPHDVLSAHAPIMCWPINSTNGEPRKETSFNRLWILQTPTAIVGFSVICPHAGCLVSGWNGERRLLVCPCHSSAYDVDHNGQVMDGPAPSPLPYVHIVEEEGFLRIASAISRPVGAHASRAD